LFLPPFLLGRIYSSATEPKTCAETFTSLSSFRLTFTERSVFLCYVLRFSHDLIGDFFPSPHSLFSPILTIRPPSPPFLLFVRMALPASSLLMRNISRLCWTCPPLPLSLFFPLSFYGVAGLLNSPGAASFSGFLFPLFIWRRGYFAVFPIPSLVLPFPDVCA